MRRTVPGRDERRPARDEEPREETSPVDEEPAVETPAEGTAVSVKVATGATTTDARVVLANAFAFGGSNVSLAIGSAESSTS